MLGLASVGQFFGNAVSEMTKIADGILAIANSLVEIARDATMGNFAKTLFYYLFRYSLFIFIVFS